MKDYAKREEGKKIARELESMVNGGNEEKAQGFLEGFMSMHNTLQQRSFTLILRCIKAMAETTWIDGRNEESQKRAKLMIAGIKEQQIKELMVENPIYWDEDKAREYVENHWDFTKLPLI